MGNEFNLSEKECEILFAPSVYFRGYNKIDVKEFIKQLKERCDKSFVDGIDKAHLSAIIDKLVGSLFK